MYTDDGKYIVQLIPKGGAAAAAGGAGGCGTTSCSGAASDAGSGTEEYLAAMTAAGASGGVAGAAGAQMSRGVGGAAGAGGVRSRSAGASVSGRSKLPMALGALGVVGLCAGAYAYAQPKASPTASSRDLLFSQEEAKGEKSLLGGVWQHLGGWPLPPNPITFSGGGAKGERSRGIGTPKIDLPSIGRGIDMPKIDLPSVGIPEGSIKLPDGSFSLPDGSVKFPDVKLPEGVSLSDIKIPKGSIQLPNGSFELPDGSMKMPDLSSLPEGVHMPGVPRGSTQLSDGSIKLPDGSVELPDGSVQKPEAAEAAAAAAADAVEKGLAPEEATEAVEAAAAAKAKALGHDLTPEAVSALAIATVGALDKGLTSEEVAKAALLAAAAAPSLPPCGPGLVTIKEMKEVMSKWTHSEENKVQGEAKILKLLINNHYVAPYEFISAKWSAVSEDGRHYSATYTARASCKTPECLTANPTWKEKIVVPLGEAEFDVCVEDAATKAAKADAAERSIPVQSCADTLTTGGCGRSALTYNFNGVDYTTCEGFGVDLKKALEPFGDRGVPYDQCSNDTPFGKSVQRCCRASCGLCIPGLNLLDAQTAALSSLLPSPSPSPSAPAPASASSPSDLLVGETTGGEAVGTACDACETIVDYLEQAGFPAAAATVWELNAEDCEASWDVDDPDAWQPPSSLDEATAACGEAIRELDSGEAGELGVYSGYFYYAKSNPE